MKTIKIKRPDHITILLKEMQEEFKQLGIEITLDQAQCLQDLRHWTGVDLKEIVDETSNTYDVEEEK